MKKYLKPSLRGLGLLRVATHFSAGDPPGKEYGSGGSGNGSGSGNTEDNSRWTEHGHGTPGALI